MEHYTLERPRSLPLQILRIHILESPYNTDRALAHTFGSKDPLDTSKTIFVAFPDKSPFVYVSQATAPGQVTSGEGRSLRKIVIDVRYY